MTEIKIETDSDVCNALKEELGGYRAFPASLAAAPDPVRTALAAFLAVLRTRSQILADGYEIHVERKVFEAARVALRAAPQPLSNPLGSGMREALRSVCKAGGDLGCSCADRNYQWFNQSCREDMATAVKQMLTAVASANTLCRKGEGGAREALASVAFTLGWTDLKGMTVDQMAGRLRDAARFAASAIDRHLGDSDPANGSDDPLFIALQKLSAALGPVVSRPKSGGAA